VVLLAVYLLIALAPLALAYMQGLPRRSFSDELSSALAMVAFAMLLMEFVLSGRSALRSLVVVMRNAPWSAIAERHVEGIEDQTGAQMTAHRPADPTGAVCPAILCSGREPTCPSISFESISVLPLVCDRLPKVKSRRSGKISSIA
jgi:hypothetical protein